MPLAIEYRPLAELQPYDRNARTHSAEQIAAIERSLARFGWAAPIATADGVLIYGHARRQAALNLRKRNIAIPNAPDADLAPVVDLSHLSDAERKAYVIADNQLATLAGWDEAILATELSSLSGMAFDLSVLGFSSVDLADYKSEPASEDDKGALLALADVARAEPLHVVEAGAHFVLSERHHLLCQSVIEGWPSWLPLLTPHALFLPYPGPFVAISEKAKSHALIMVQPDTYAAGSLLDRYAEAFGEDAIKPAQTVPVRPARAA